MRMQIMAQTFRRFDVPCGAYLRDEQGALVPDGSSVSVEAIPYRGQVVAESWPAEIGERGHLEWVVPAASKLVRGLYQLRVRAGNRLLGLGLLEVV